MRVLHICDSLNPAGLGGYESYLYYLSSAMKKRGHESFIVTQASNESGHTSGMHGEARLLLLRGNGLEVRKWKYLAAPPHEREVLAKQIFSDDDLEQNVRILVRELSDVISHLRPSVIHAHSTYVVFNRVLERMRESGNIGRTPMLLTVHGLPKPLVLPGGVETTDYEQLAMHMPFDSVLAVSNCVCDALKHQLERETPVPETMYLGVDLDTFKPTLGTKNWSVAFMGRLEFMKSVDLLPDIFEELTQSMESVRFAISGDGSLRTELLRELENRKLSSKVDYLGVVPWDEVPRVLNQTRVFLYPSRREPFGLSIVEAMACGVTVVTSNAFGPAEIVTSMSDGISVEPEVEGIVSAVERLLENDDLYARISCNARRTVEDRFSLNTHVDSLLEIYTETVETRKSEGNEENTDRRL
ncbi:MAG: glycosyltransferase family 4 protein [Candidatus Thorarchaeota archaeon]